MSLNRREFVQLMGIAAAAGLVPGCDNQQSPTSKGSATSGAAAARKPEDLYNVPKFVMFPSCT